MILYSNTKFMACIEYVFDLTLNYLKGNDMINSDYDYILSSDDETGCQLRYSFKAGKFYFLDKYGIKNETSRDNLDDVKKLFDKLVLNSKDENLSKPSLEHFYESNGFLIAIIKEFYFDNNFDRMWKTERYAISSILVQELCNKTINDSDLILDNIYSVNSLWFVFPDEVLEWPNLVHMPLASKFSDIIKAELNLSFEPKIVNNKHSYIDNEGIVWDIAVDRVSVDDLKDLPKDTKLYMEGKSRSLVYLTKIKRNAESTTLKTVLSQNPTQLQFDVLANIYRGKIRVDTYPTEFTVTALENVQLCRDWFMKKYEVAVFNYK